ncbi:hypothetical protein PT300_14665 [Enterobacteriaceae bacterium ESL0689]|nr:hypothetical protein [Enterobacteriaceae bacterium ESL0689]
MKIEHLLFISFALYSAAGFAAFSKTENVQLASINQKSTGEVKSSLDSLNRSIDKQISNNPGIIL